MPPGPIFRRLRATAFTCVLLVALAWTALLCVELFLRWDVSDDAQRSLVVVMILIDTITVIMMPVLLILEFRVWLDAARMLLLLTAHIGVAAGFTTWDPKYQCPDDTPDDNGVCKLVDMYIVLGSWVIPALLLVYSVCLAIAVYLNRGQSQEVVSGKWNVDIEAVTPIQAQLPIMPPPKDRTTVSSITHMSSSSRYSRPSWLQGSSSAPQPPPITEGQDVQQDDDAQEKDGSARSSARLSKRLPARFF